METTASVLLAGRVIKSVVEFNGRTITEYEDGSRLVSPNTLILPPPRFTETLLRSFKPCDNAFHNIIEMLGTDFSVTAQEAVKKGVTYDQCLWVLRHWMKVDERVMRLAHQWNREYLFRLMDHPVFNACEWLDAAIQKRVTAHNEVINGTMSHTQFMQTVMTIADECNNVTNWIGPWPLGFHSPFRDYIYDTLMANLDACPYYGMRAQGSLASINHRAAITRDDKNLSLSTLCDIFSKSEQINLTH